MSLIYCRTLEEVIDLNLHRSLFLPDIDWDPLNDPVYKRWYNHEYLDKSIDDVQPCGLYGTVIFNENDEVTFVMYEDYFDDDDDINDVYEPSQYYGSWGGRINGEGLLGQT